MKKMLMGILTITAILALSSNAKATILFSDNFDSSGSLGSYATYNGSPSIENGVLCLPYVSTVTTKHNFTDEAIIAAGGFIVEFDALRNSSGSLGLGKDQGNANGEFGVGWRADSAGLYIMNAGYGEDRLVTTESS